MLGLIGRMLLGLWNLPTKWLMICINNGYSSSTTADRSPVIPLKVNVTLQAQDKPQVSPLTVASFDTIMDEHPFDKNDEMPE